MRKTSTAPTIPTDLAARLASNPESDRIFRALPPSHQREFIKWITEAKKLETRRRRVAKAAKKVQERASI